MIGFEKQLSLFKLIGNELKEKVECFAIGGNAMMFYNAKTETKDVDLIFLKKEELIKVKRALYSIGFEDKNKLVKIFRHYELQGKKNRPVMMVSKDDRFDLFLEEVITFKISDAIIKRVKEKHEFNNLIIKIISPEDIILLKCATERAKDRNDAASLIEMFNINWDIIIEESINQTKLEEYLFPVFLYDFLYELKEDFKADIPKEVLDKIRKISEDMMVKKLKK